MTTYRKRVHDGTIDHANDHAKLESRSTPTIRTRGPFTFFIARGVDMTTTELHGNSGRL